MSDIVERLRNVNEVDLYDDHLMLLRKEAATEIERLRAGIKLISHQIDSMAVQAGEVASSVAEARKANDELGRILNMSFSDVRDEIHKRHSIG